MRLAARSKIKTRLETAYGEWVERIPAWIKWATQVRWRVLLVMLCIVASSLASRNIVCSSHHTTSQGRPTIHRPHIPKSVTHYVAAQEWNEIQFNGVFYSPPLGPGEPGVLDAEHSYTFKYPRPDRRVAFLRMPFRKGPCLVPRPHWLCCSQGPCS